MKYPNRSKRSKKKKCAVKNCKSRVKTNPTLSFHYFPAANKDTGEVEITEKRSAWLNALNMNDAGKHSLVCSLHFKKSDYYLSGKLCYIKS